MGPRRQRDDDAVVRGGITLWRGGGGAPNRAFIIEGGAAYASQGWELESLSFEVAICFNRGAMIFATSKLARSSLFPRLGGLSQFEWQSARLSLAIDTGDDRIGFDQSFGAASDHVSVGDPDLLQPRHLGGQRQRIVEFGRHSVADVHFGHYQHQSPVLQLLVGDPGGTKHFHTSAFEVIQVIGVMNAALAIGIVITNAQFNLVGPWLLHRWLAHPGIGITGGSGLWGATAAELETQSGVGRTDRIVVELTSMAKEAYTSAVCRPTPLCFTLE